MTRLLNLTRTPLCLLLAASVALPGCVTSSMLANTDDPNDVCRPQRAALRVQGDYFASDILQDAAIGAAVAGVAVGLLTGDLRSGLIAAGTGAVVGGATGYLSARRKKQNDEALLRQSVIQDVERDNEGLDKAQQALDQLMTCRRGEAQRVREAFRRGDINRQAADVQMRGVKQRWDVDIQLAQSIGESVGKRATGYSEAANELDKGILDKEREMLSRAWLAAITATTGVGTTPGGVGIAQLEPGQTVRVVSESGTDRQVILNDGRLGWVLAGNLTRETQGKRQTVTSNAPVFASPTAKASIVETVARGQQRIVTANFGQFAVVDLGNGQRGFMRQVAFARNTPAPDAVASEAPTASGAQIMKASLTNQSKRDNFTSTVQTAQASESALFELTS